MTKSRSVPLIEPVIHGNEARYLRECIDSGYVSSVGPFVPRFEKEFADTVGAKHAVACASGTAALHVALRLTGATTGRLVAVSTFTFIASANAASYTGADLLLVDSEPETWNMDTNLLRDEVVRRARNGERLPDIVEIVHVLGQPANMEPLLELREEFGIRIVEDAAESLGAYWCRPPLTDRQVGTVGDVGCFSFNGNKIITTGGGGMIVTKDAWVAERAKHLTTQAKRSESDYFHDEIGYNYRLTNLCAALGTAQLEYLPVALRNKASIASRYDAWLSDVAVTVAPRTTWSRSSYWLYSLLLEGNDPTPGAAVARLSEQGIQTRRLWPPLHCQDPYRSAERIRGEVAERLYARGLSLPSSANLSRTDQRMVTDAVKAFLLT